MIKKHNKQGGFATIIILLIVVLVVAGGAAYMVYNKNTNTKKDVTDIYDTPAEKKPKFKNTDEIYSAIADVIKNTSLDVEISSQNKVSPNSGTTQDYTKKESSGTISYTSGTSYRLTKKCNTDCGEMLSDEGHMMTKYFVTPDALKSMLSQIAGVLLYHQGIAKTASGTEAGTYVNHDYVAFSVTYEDGTKTNLVMSTQGGDGGMYILVYAY